MSRSIRVLWEACREVKDRIPAPEGSNGFQPVEHRTAQALELAAETIRSLVREAGSSSTSLAEAAAGAAEGKRVSWQEAQRYLEGCRLRGEPFTDYEDMAVRVGCSGSTIHKAIKKGQVELQEWAHKQHAPSRLNVSPEAAAVALETVPQRREPAPGDALEQAEVDAALQYLRQEAVNIGPEAVARIESLDPADRRKMAELVYRDPDRAEQAERYRRAARLKRRD